MVINIQTNECGSVTIYISIFLFILSALLIDWYRIKTIMSIKQNHYKNNALETTYMCRRGLGVLRSHFFLFCCTCFVCTCLTHTSSWSVRITFAWAGTKKKEDDVYWITYIQMYMFLLCHEPYRKEEEERIRHLHKETSVTSLNFTHEL